MKSLILFILCFVLEFVLHAQATNNLDKEMSAYLASLRSRMKFSGEVIIAKADTILFNKSVGLASIEYDVPLRNGAKYRIASITKSFTAYLVASAVSENKLRFEDKASQYLERLSPALSDITIHQLLTHTSGLPHNEGIDHYWKIKSKLYLTNDQVLDEINSVNLLSNPGTSRKYSSLGYYLLALVLEAIYKTDYSSILSMKIFKPLSMDDSGSGDIYAIESRLTSPYHLISDDSIIIAPYRSYSMLKGAGDMFSTARNLLKWNNAVFSGSLLPLELTKRMFVASPPNDDNKDSYGYGWYIRNGSRQRIYHGGGTWGYSSINAFYPKEKISVIVLSNISTLPTESICDEIESILFQDDHFVDDAEIGASRDSLDTSIYVGQFESDSGKGLLAVKADKSRLFIQLAGNPAFEIYYKGEHTFIGKKIQIEIQFKIDNGVIQGLSARRMGQTFHFKKL